VSEEIQHVIRPRLPWRTDEAMTECGRPAGDGDMTRDEAIAKVKRLGKVRASLSSCMTCWQTASRWPGWDRSPSSVMARYAKGLGFWVGRDPADDSPRARMDIELRAIAALVEAHREEFDAYVEGASAAPSLDAVRRRRARPVRSDYPRPL